MSAGMKKAMARTRPAQTDSTCHLRAGSAVLSIASFIASSSLYSFGKTHLIRPEADLLESERPAALGATLFGKAEEAVSALRALAGCWQALVETQCQELPNGPQP